MNSDRLSRIELFAFDTRPSFARKPVLAGSVYLVLRLTCGEQVYYGECVVTMNGKALDLIKWGAFLLSIHHSSLEELLMEVRLHGQGSATCRCTGELNLSRLIDESVSYYSIFPKI